AALWQRPARPPDDAALAADLGELRMVLASVGDAGKQAADTQRLLRRQTELETAIRRRALHAAAGGDAGAEGPPRTARLQGALGERALVEFVQDGRRLCAGVGTAAGLDGAGAAGPRGSSADPGGLLLVAGPGLPQAAAEVGALAERHAGATVLPPAAASVAAVAAALEIARLAHIASHGTFRADNPLFSALDLAAGPLTVYDLARLRAAPRDTILSACDGGAAAVRPADPLM